jgi:hypothetical protein
MEAHMKLRHLFTINIFIAAFFGLACAFFPAWSLRLYGLDPTAAAIWTTRLVGGSILGFATLMYFGRTSADPETRRAIALALLIQDLVGLLASLEIQLRGSINTLGWSNLVLYGLLALGYAWFRFIKPEAS